MPKYTITTDAGGGPDASTSRLSFPAPRLPPTMRRSPLAMARDRIPTTEQAGFAVAIHDEDGQHVYRAGLHFEAEGSEHLKGN